MDEKDNIGQALKDIHDALEKLRLERQTKWNENHDSLLMLWKKQAHINMWLQLASNYYYTRLNDYLSYPAIIVSTATSIGVFGIDDKSLAGKFVISILALLCGVLTAINKHCRAAEKSQEFALRAKDYYTFIREIDFILSTSHEERPFMTETLERVKGTYDRIVDMQLEPPIHVVRDYEKKFRPLANSLFSDLQSELRSQSATSSQSEKIKTAETQLEHSPTSKPKSTYEHQIDINNLRHAAHLKSYVPTKKITSTIFSPYQLFSTDPFVSNLGTIKSQQSLRQPLPLYHPNPTLNRLFSEAISIDITKDKQRHSPTSEVMLSKDASSKV